MRTVLAAAVAVMLVLSVPAAAQKAPPRGGPPAGQGGAATVFDESQREVIREFFHTQAEQAAMAEAERKAEAAKKARKAAREAAKAGKSAKTKHPQKAKAAKKSKAKAKTRDKGRDKGKAKPTPPGSATRDAHPHGLQQHLERGGALPPGLAKRKFPPELDVQLPKIGRGQERAIVGEDVVLLEKKTGRILDVIEGVVRGGH